MENSDSESVISLACQYLKRHTTMSLATCLNNQAWSADLFYASDAQCRLYFVSSSTTRHCQHIAANPRVSVSICGEFTDWGEIKGLQLDGMADLVSTPERESVIETYLAKFPSLLKLYETPEKEQDRQVVSRLLESSFYRISPKWIRLIDNSKGFAHKEEAIF